MSRARRIVSWLAQRAYETGGGTVFEPKAPRLPRPLRLRHLLPAAVSVVLSAHAANEPASPGRPNTTPQIANSYDPRLAELKRLPASEVVSQMSVGPYVVLITRGREAFLREIAGLGPIRRRLTLLDMVDQGWGRDGLHTFFLLKGADVAPEIVAALQESGLERQRHLMALAVAMFGSPYPVDEAARSQRFGYSKPGGELNYFDHVLIGVASAFGTQVDYRRALDSYVHGHAEVLAVVEAERGRLSDETRLGWLQARLAQRVPLGDSATAVAAALRALPDDYRTLAVLGIFNDEFMNGGVHQFFFNSSGDIAPLVIDALDSVDLPRQADLMRKCLTFFPVPYPIETAARRKASFGGEWSDWDKRLSAVTDEFWGIEDAGVVQSKTIAFAKAKNLLPD